MSNTRNRVAIVGVGKQGAGVARIVTGLGYDIVGAVDVGEKVGKPLSEVLGGVGPAVRILPSVDDLLGSVADIDIAILAAAVPQDVLVAQAEPLLARGVNVLTLHQDLLSPHPSWTDALDATAKSGGATFLSSGAQDSWWIQLPALAASSSVSVSRIRVSSSLSLEALSVGLSEIIGIGQTQEEFAGTAAMMLHAPAVLGTALMEAARRIGCIPGEITKTYEAVYLDDPYQWGEGQRTIEAGRAVGTQEIASFDTDRGIRFEGVFRVLPINVEAAVDELDIFGEPELHLRYEPFPGEGITNAALVARIPDVINAAPGVVFAADLPPARHHFPLA